MLFKLFSCLLFITLSCSAFAQQDSHKTVLTKVTFLKYRFYKDSILSRGRMVYDTMRTEHIKDQYFSVKATAHNRPYGWLIPFPKEDVKKQDPPNDLLIPREMFSYSIKENYIIKDTSFTVYKFDTYNCYDPMCGQRHNQLRFKTGVIFFSPEYGFLLEKEGDFYSFLISTKEEKIPAALLTAILKKNPVPAKVVNSYKKDLKQSAFEE